MADFSDSYSYDPTGDSYIPTLGTDTAVSNYQYSMEPAALQEIANQTGSDPNTVSQWLSANPALASSLLTALGTGVNVATALKTAGVQTGAADNALAFQQQQYNDTIKRQTPFYNAGVGALNQLATGIQPGGQFTAAGTPNTRLAGQGQQQITQFSPAQINVLNGVMGGPGWERNSPQMSQLLLSLYNTYHNDVGRDPTTQEIQQGIAQLNKGGPQAMASIATGLANTPEAKVYDPNMTLSTNFQGNAGFDLSGMPVYQSQKSNSAKAYSDIQNTLTGAPKLNLKDFNFTFDPSQDPGARFKTEEALASTAAQQGAQGMYGSGNMATALQEGASDLASQEYQNAYNRALQTYGVNTASQTANYNATVQKLIQSYGMDMQKAQAIAGAMQADTSLNLQDAMNQYNTQMENVQYKNYVAQQALQNENAATAAKNAMVQQQLGNTLGGAAAAQNQLNTVAGYGTGAANALTGAGANATNAVAGIYGSQANALTGANTALGNTITAGMGNLSRIVNPAAASGNTFQIQPYTGA